MRAGSVDGLSTRYSAVANDDNQSTKTREAAMLLAVAEGHIRAEEEEDALVAAQDALKHFREVSDHCSIADSVRVIVQCYVCQGRLEEAMALARDEASVFKKAAKKSEEGKMLLALSEACPKKPANLEEALGYSRDALNLFQEASDEKMEAAVWLTTARLLMTKKVDKEEAMKEAWQATCDALTIFRRLRDSRGEAEALHTQAEVRASERSFNAAIEAAQDALDLFHELNLKKQEAFELQHIATLLVAADKPRKSLEFAEEALEIIRGISGSAKREVAALGSVVEALIARGRTKKAVQVAVKGLQRFQDAGEIRAEAKAQMILQGAYEANGDAIKARATWMKALEVAAEAGEKRMEYDMCLWAADVHLKNIGEGELAIKMANRGLEAATEMKDDEAISEALKRMVRGYVAIDDLTKAVETAKENREMMERSGSTKGEAHACLVLSEAHCAARNFDLAAAAAKAAGEIAYQEDDESLEGASLDVLTTINMEAGKFEKAARSAEQARRIWHSLNDTPKECNALSQAGMAFVNQAYKKQSSGKTASSVSGFFEKATKASNDCLALTEQLPGFSGQPFAANANCVLSQVHAATGEIELSLSTAKEAVKLFSTVGDSRGEGYGNVLIAQAQAELKKWDVAQKHANAAMKLFNKVKDDSGKEFAETLLTKIEKNMPKPEPVYAAAPVAWGPPGGAKAWNTGPSMQMSMQMDMAGPAADDAGAKVAMRKRDGPGLDLSLLTEEVLIGKIKEVALAIIGDDGEVDGDTPLMEAGVTSSTAVILKDELSSEVPGVKLPPTLIFDYPSINAISEYIMETVGK